jgi:hypothetical protein
MRGIVYFFQGNDYSDNDIPIPISNTIPLADHRIHRTIPDDLKVVGDRYGFVEEMQRE